MSTCVYNRMYCVLPVARVVQLYYSNTTVVESYSYSRKERVLPVARLVVYVSEKLL